MNVFLITQTFILNRLWINVFSMNFSQALLESVQTKMGEKKYSFVDLFKTSNIRKISVCSGIVW